MKRIRNKNLEKMLKKPIPNLRFFDIGYECAVANALEWFDGFVRDANGNINVSWDKGGKENFIEFMMRE